MTFDFLHMVITEVIATDMAGTIAGVETIVTDAIATVVRRVYVDRARIIEVHGAPAIFTEEDIRGAGRAEVFVVFTYLDHFREGMLVATIGAGNEGSVVAVVV